MCGERVHVRVKEVFIHGGRSSLILLRVKEACDRFMRQLFAQFFFFFFLFIYGLLQRIALHIHLTLSAKITDSKPSELVVLTLTLTTNKKRMVTQPSHKNKIKEEVKK